MSWIILANVAVERAGAQACWTVMFFMACGVCIYRLIKDGRA